MEHKSDFELMKHTLYLTLTSELYAFIVSHSR